MAVQIVSGLIIGNGEPVDDRITVASAAARLGTTPDTPIFDDYVYRGMLVYQRDTQQLYNYIGPGEDYNPATNNGIMLPVGDESYWMEITNQASDPGIVAEGEIAIDGTEIELGVSFIRRPISLAADLTGQSVSFPITIENLPSGLTHEITDITSDNGQWSTAILMNGDNGFVGSPAAYIPSSSNVTISYTLGGSLTPIVSDPINLSVYEPIYVTTSDTNISAHRTLSGMSRINEFPRAGIQVTLTHVGTGVSYGIINVPTSFKGGGTPLFLVGGFSFTPTSYSPPNVNNANSRYTTYVVPLRQTTVVTIN